MKYVRELVFGHNKGFSCAYRNYDSQSEESPMLHGYSLTFSLRFASNDEAIMGEYLDEKMAWMTQYLEEIFRNTVIVSHDDPLLDAFVALENAGACELRMIDTVGASAFAKVLYEDFSARVKESTAGSVILFEVKVRENGNYSASYTDTTVLESLAVAQQ